MKHLQGALCILLILSTVALAGCDLGGTPPTPAPTIRPTTAAGATVPPASPAVTPAVAGSPAAGMPFDQASPALDALPSYQWTAQWALTASQGEAISPLSWRSEGTRVKDGDRWHITWALGAGDVELEVIHIGDQEWVKFGEQWVETPKPQQWQFLRFTPPGWWDELSIGLEEHASLVSGPDERVNDVLCRRYRTTEQYKGVVVSGGVNWSHQGDVWLAADGGYPVRGRFLGTGAIQSVPWTLTQELDITHMADPANAVSPPR
jgi:hypothetical protein